MFHVKPCVVEGRDGNVPAVSSTETELRLSLLIAAKGDPRTLRSILAEHGSAEAAFASTALRTRLRVGSSDASHTGLVAAVKARTSALGARWASPTDACFPAALAGSDCQLLCIAGEVPAGDCVGIVGSREADEYGLRVARGIASSLARVGVVIVSGGARGADSAAHSGALEGGGQTVVVLGAGIGSAMASRQAGLFSRCLLRGAIVSEYLPDAAGGKWMFPERNRLVARMSLAVVVAQAAIRSGSLITARLAHELGRPVFAPPGDVGYPLSEGTNLLLFDGRARVLIHPRDLESVLGPRGLGAVGWPRGYARGTMVIPEPPAVGVGPVSSVHELVLSFLQGRGPVMPETVESRFGPQAGRALLELELEGLVRRAEGGAFVAS